MRKLNCIEVEQDLWRYVDRELPATGVAAVSEHLRSCDACQKLYHDRAREANVCRGVLSASSLGSESSDRIVKAMEREGLFREASWGEEPRGQVVGGLGRFRGRLALVAMFLIAATVGLGWILRGDAPARLGEFETDGVVFRSTEPGAPAEVFSSGSCMSGNQFVVEEDVELSLRLGTPFGRPGATLTVTGPAKLTLGATSTPDDFSALLDSGVLTADVHPRQASFGFRPFVIRTPEAVVSVVGTAFVVDRTAEGVTRLDVSHGEVDFRPVDAPIGQTGLRVSAAMGPHVVRSGDPSSPDPLTVITDDPTTDPGTAGNAALSSADATSESDVGGASQKLNPSVPVESPDGGAGSTGAPALGASDASDSPDLDQVVNPHRDDTDEE